MPCVKINWTPLSSYSTPLQSDTVFGHLCWALLYLQGEDKLNQILAEMNDKPFLVSSAFPQGKLPRPNYPIRKEQTDKTREQLNVDELIWSAKLKKLKKIRWLDRDEFFANKCVFNPIQSLIMLYSNLENRTDEIEQQELVFHNVINRSKSTSDNVFAEETIYPVENMVFESYLSTELLNEEDIRQCLNYIEYSGFGKKKSTGKGYFKVDVEKYEFPKTGGSNAYLSLSNHIPSPEDSKDVYYSHLVKYGKLGGQVSANLTPFKYPVFVFTPGTLYKSETMPKGTVLSGIHPDKPEIIQNLTNFAIPIRLED